MVGFCNCIRKDQAKMKWWSHKMVTKNRWLFLQKGSIVEVQLGSKYSCSINHQISPIFNNSGILIYSQTIKVNESWYIELFGVSGSIEKVFSTNCVNNDLFSTFFSIHIARRIGMDLPHIAHIMLTSMFFVFKT